MISESPVTPHLSQGTFDVAAITVYPKYLVIAQERQEAPHQIFAVGPHPLGCLVPIYRGWGGNCAFFVVKNCEKCHNYLGSHTH